MTRWDFYLCLVLRLIGSTSLLAFLAVLMPYSWMNAIHQELGMGELPTAPIVGYLARSTSAFYALYGGLLWLVSFDPHRYSPIIRYLGFAMLIMGISLAVIDLNEGLPAFWRISEGPIVILYGVLILWLNSKRTISYP